MLVFEVVAEAPHFRSGDGWDAVMGIRGDSTQGALRTRGDWEAVIKTYCSRELGRRERCRRRNNGTSKNFAGTRFVRWDAETEECVVREGKRDRQSDKGSLHCRPLRRLLLSLVGRVWSEIQGALFAALGTRTTDARWQRKMIRWLVFESVLIEDEKVYVCDQPTRFKGPTYREGRSGSEQFYVHPETGILCRFPERPKPRARSMFPTKVLSNNVLAMFVRGSWYRVTLVRFAERRQGYDPVLNSLFWNETKEMKRLLFAAYGFSNRVAASMEPLDEYSVKKLRLEAVLLEQR